MILTDQHQPPPKTYVHNGMRYATQPLIDAGDYQALADKAGCYRHESEGPGPYTDWTLTSDADGPLYHRTTRERTAEEIEQRREALQTMRSAERVRRQTETFPHDGHQYLADREESVPLMTAASIAAQAALAQGPDAVTAYETALGAGWRDADGVARITTATGILALHSAFVAWGSRCDAASQSLKQQIAAADPADFAELEAAITDDARWP